MSLVVEDGTGLSTAQSYVSVADAGTYLAAAGDTTWAAATDPAREAALVRATRALDAMYSARWPGVRILSSQALDWPRFDAVDADGYDIIGVPQAVKNACAEAALVELGSAGALSSSLDRGGSVKREKVVGIEVEYAAGAPASTVYRTIGQALARIVRSGGIKITRG